MATRRKITPLSIFVTIVLVIHAMPIVTVVATSFSSTKLIYFPPKGLGLTGYHTLLSQPEFLAAFRLSIVLAVLTGVCALILGVPAAFAVVRHRFRGAAVIETFLLSPLMMPTIAIGIAMLVFYSRLGVPKSWFTIFVGHMVVAVPYVMRVVTASVVGVDRSLERAAQNLGASSAKTFFYITLPIIRPGVIAGLVFAFVVSWEEVNITVFLAGVGSTTLPVEILNYVSSYGTDSAIAAMSAVLLVVGALGLVIVERTVGIRGSVGVEGRS